MYEMKCVLHCAVSGKQEATYGERKADAGMLSILRENYMRPLSIDVGQSLLNYRSAFLTSDHHNLRSVPGMSLLNYRSAFFQVCLCMCIFHNKFTRFVYNKKVNKLRILTSLNAKTFSILTKESRDPNQD